MSAGPTTRQSFLSSAFHLSGPTDIAGFKISAAQTARQREKMRELRREEKDLHEQLSPIRGRIEVLHKLRDIFEFKDAKLSSPSGSSLHKLVEAGLRGKVHSIRSEDAKPDTEKLFWGNVRDTIQTFLIEHDWSAALGATARGEFIFPYEDCAFEMVVSGVRIVYVHCESSSDGIFASIDGEWAGVVVDSKFWTDDGLGGFIGRQITAVCISLDAEVATAPVTRAPYALNAAREKRGALPMYDYHTISLAKRARPPKLDDDAEPGRKRRLHFRRGHWRHYGGHKTWIKWMLVGDPDLGFVDKHYRL